MSINENDGVMDCLFSRQDMNLDNVKFFRGESDNISEEAFKAELKASAERKRNGTITPSTNAPKLRKPPVDVRDVVANM